MNNIEQELQVFEEKYQDLFEHAFDAVFLHDVNGNTYWVNRRVEDLTGYTAEELKKMRLRDILSGEGLLVAKHIRRTLLANESLPQPYEQRLVRRDGSDLFLQLTTSLVVDAGGTVLLLSIGRDITEQKRMQENSNLYSLCITIAQEEERKRVARVLYDGVLQNLAVIARQLDNIVSKGEGLSGEQRLRLGELRKNVVGIMHDVGDLGRELRPSVLDHLGLLPALEWLTSGMGERSGIEAKFNVLGASRRLPERVEIMLFRITQEALKNVWLHSGAGRAEVTLEFGESTIRLSVGDDGKGSNLPRTVSDLVKDGKLGLAGMEEKAMLLGGKLTIQSQPDTGTSITLELPAEPI